MSISAADVGALLRYEPETGHFFWQTDRRKVKAGDKAGWLKDGYVVIAIERRNYRAHRLAWLLIYGAFPPEDIDHVNGDPSDNRLANLRAASRSQNLANCATRRDTVSGFKGVGWCEPVRKYRARIQRDRRQILVGYFDTPEEAHAAYVSAAKQQFGEFARSA